jgi:hypothetical protein
MKYFKLVLGFILLVTLLINIPIQNAHAESCTPGTGCNNKDPQTTGCSVNSITQSQNYKDGPAGGSGTMYVDLRYSAYCKQVWTRVYNQWPGAVRHLKARLTNNGTPYSNLADAEDSSLYSMIWSNMYYYSGGARCARGWQGMPDSSFDANTYTCYTFP